MRSFEIGGLNAGSGLVNAVAQASMPLNEQISLRE